MNMKESLGAIGGLALLIAIMAAGVAVFTLFIQGGLWITEKALPWASTISGLAFCAVIFILLPLAIPRKTREFSATSIFVASYVFGVTGWMLALLLSYKIWGWTGVVIGLLLGGIGVIPVALLATLLNGVWAGFFLLLGLIILTYTSRIGAVSLADSVG